VLGIVLSVAVPGLNPMAYGYIRFSGAAANAGDAALNLSLGFLLCVWLIQYSPSPNIYRICSVLLLVTLILTRKRTALLGMMLALPWLLCHIPSLCARRRGLIVMLLGGLAGLTLLFAASPADRRFEEVRVFLRLTEEDDTRTSRFMQGLEYIAERPWLGHGPMSKFEDPHAITSSTYDFRRDPHSSVLCLAQHYGIPGAALFLGYLCSCVWPFFRRGKNMIRPLMQSLCLWGICSLVASVWLMSFGMPGDRLSYILFGLGLASLARVHDPRARRDRQQYRWAEQRRQSRVHAIA
jgi:O-antigen ligase